MGRLNVIQDANGSGKSNLYAKEKQEESVDEILLLLTNHIQKFAQFLVPFLTAKSI